MVCLHSVLWRCTLHKVSATGAVTVKKQIAVVNLASSCQLFGAGKVDDVFLLIQCGSSHGAEALRLKCGNLCGQHLRSLEWTCVFRSGHPGWFGAFGWYEFLAFSTLPLLTNIPSDLVGSLFANCTRDALYKNKFSAMLGMLGMARLVSRSAPTTSSMLVIKMGRSFTTLRPPSEWRYCQWQHHSKVFAKSTCDFLFGFCAA